MGKNPDTETKRILAIDGGGIKGAIPAAFIYHIEDTLEVSLRDHFDLIAGTSTGGIIALGLGMGMSGKEILDFYKFEGSQIFCGSIWKEFRRFFSHKYRPTALKNSLEKAFEDKILGDSSVRLLIPAYANDGPHVFKTAHDERLKRDWKDSAVDVALATSAAPTYFPVYNIKNGPILADGGVVANNPVLMAVIEAIAVLGWNRSAIRVLSLGCGAQSLNTSKGINLAGFLKAEKLWKLVTHAQSFGAIGGAKLLIGCGGNQSPENFLRIEPNIDLEKLTIDALKMEEMIHFGARLARENSPQVDKIFVKPGKAERFTPFYSRSD